MKVTCNIKRYRRFAGWDYAKGASLFITIATEPRRALFGRIVNGAVALSPLGEKVKEAVEALLGPDAQGLCPPEEGVPGKYMVDLKEANRRRLLQLGVRAEHIDVSPDCTMCMADVYWSHRATKGQRGTQAAVIML